MGRNGIVMFKLELGNKKPEASGQSAGTTADEEGGGARCEMVGRPSDGASNERAGGCASAAFACLMAGLGHELGDARAVFDNH